MIMSGKTLPLALSHYWSIKKRNFVFQISSPPHKCIYYIVGHQFLKTYPHLLLFLATIIELSHPKISSKKDIVLHMGNSNSRKSLPIDKSFNLPSPIPSWPQGTDHNDTFYFSTKYFVIANQLQVRFPVNQFLVVFFLLLFLVYIFWLFSFILLMHLT